MKKTIFPVILSIFIFFSLNQTIFCQQQPPLKNCEITFDSGEYKGPYYIVGNKNPYFRKNEIPLAPNDAAKPFYTLEIGSVGYTKSQTAFAVAQNCRVRQFDKLDQPASVKFKKRSVTFRNVSIEVNPQDYSGDYFFKGFFPYAPYNFNPSRGANTFTAVPNVDSFISIYGSVGKTEIYFNIGEDGKLSNVSNFTAASACGHTLTLNNISISVNPATFTGLYRLGGENYRGAQPKLSVIPGIPLQVDIRRIGGSERYVTPWVTHIDPDTIDVPDSDTTFQKFTFGVNR